MGFRVQGPFKGIMKACMAICRAQRLLGFWHPRVYRFRPLGSSVLGFRVFGFVVLGFWVLGFRLEAVGVCPLKELLGGL